MKPGIKELKELYDLKNSPKNRLNYAQHVMDSSDSIILLRGNVPGIGEIPGGTYMIPSGIWRIPFKISDHDISINALGSYRSSGFNYEEMKKIINAGKGDELDKVLKRWKDIDDYFRQDSIYEVICNESDVELRNIHHGLDLEIGLKEFFPLNKGHPVIRDVSFVRKNLGYMF